MMSEEFIVTPMSEKPGETQETVQMLNQESDELKKELVKKDAIIEHLSQAKKDAAILENEYKEFKEVNEHQISHLVSCSGTLVIRINDLQTQQSQNELLIANLREENGKVKTEIERLNTLFKGRASKSAANETVSETYKEEESKPSKVHAAFK